MKLATFEKDGYILEDAEQLNKAYPETFWIPDFAIRSSIESGTTVKLIFKLLDLDSDDGTSIERMWVEVDELENGLYLGTLDNDPFANVPLKSGDDILFGPEHIIDIYEE